METPLRHANLPLALDLQPRWVQASISVGLAGFLAVMAQVSFPLPWTPVPFSMMPFALLVVGAFQRPLFAALSVALYLAAGAAGLPVYAEGEAGIQHLVGHTGGYLFGFLLVPPLVSFYLQRRRPLMPVRRMAWLGAAVGVLVVLGIAVIAWMWRTGSGLHAWGVQASTLWILAFVVAVAGAGAAWTLGRREQRRQEVLNLFFVHLGALAVLHVLGFTVLWLLTPLSLIQAIALGTVVFLPFDVIKAALAVGLTVPLLPSEVPDA